MNLPRFVLIAVGVLVVAVVIDYTWTLPIYVMGEVTHPNKYNAASLWRRCLQTKHRRMPIEWLTVGDGRIIGEHELLWFVFTPNSGDALKDGTDLDVSYVSGERFGYGISQGEGPNYIFVAPPTTEKHFREDNNKIRIFFDGVREFIDSSGERRVYPYKITPFMSGSWFTGRTLRVRVTRACYRPWKRDLTVVTQS